MHLVPGLAWEFSDAPPVPLDPRLLPLLRAVAQTGSLAAAVADRGLSYRAAWGLLRAYHRKLGSPLVVLERGRGASLALLGERLVGADGSARRRLARTFQRLSLELDAPADVKRAPVPRLTIAASHDFAFAALREAMRADNGLKLDLSYEEFTHAAVAATVASGGADVGFGLRAAAAKYALAFVPQIRERYWLAVRSVALQSVPITRLMQTLQGPMFTRIVKRLPGYHPIAAGTVANIGALRSRHRSSS